MQLLGSSSGAAPAPACPGCGASPWNGQPGEYCTRRCRDLHAGPRQVPGKGPALTHMPAAPTANGAKPFGSQAGAAADLEPLTSPAVLKELQALLDGTLKSVPNWTRDRGCRLHGVNSCDLVQCASQNPAPVPARLVLVRAQHNRNAHLWRQYARARDAVQRQCAGDAGFHDVAVSTAGVRVGAAPEHPALPRCNEWRLFHGAARQACEAICADGFDPQFQGRGATYKRRPLYGWGFYFAERSTKADEYAQDQGTCTLLVCRVVGGRPLVVPRDSVSEAELQRDVVGGPHHSVLGDREALGKPYREIVVYDHNQVFPEYLLTYQRV